MPNWINGSLKVRGSYDKVKEFFVNSINVYETVWGDGSSATVIRSVDKDQWMKVEEFGEPGARECDIDINWRDWAYIEWTKRAFISSEHINFYEPSLKSEKESEAIAVAEVNQAWDFRVDDWTKLAKKYGVDIRLWGLECGGQFGHEIIVSRSGDILKDQIMKYDNWDWEAPLPWLGG